MSNLMLFRSPDSVVLKLLSLGRLWKGLLNLQNTSNRMLIIIKVSFIDETTKRNMHHLL